MKTSPPNLLPIFRSDGQSRILARLFLHPDRRFSLSDLARETDLNPASVQREVTRLEAAGIVATTRVGTARIVHVDETSPIHDELSGLVVKTLGPPVVLAAALAELSGIERAFIFGSWASRMLGHVGAVPADIDLLVVGTPDRRALSAACARAGATLGREVQATVVAPGDWDPPRTGFLRSLHEGALVPVRLRGDGG